MQGRPYCTLRLKCGTRLIGEHHSRGCHEMESVYRDMVLRKVVLSETDDSTFQEWEDEIDRSREKYRIAIEKLVAISKRKTINDVPEPAIGFICSDDEVKDEDDFEEDDPVVNQYEQFDQHDEEDDDLNPHGIQIQYMIDNGIRVKGGSIRRVISKNALGWPKYKINKSTGEIDNGLHQAFPVDLPSPEAQIFLRGEQPFDTI